MCQPNSTVPNYKANNNNNNNNNNNSNNNNNIILLTLYKSRMLGVL